MLSAKNSQAKACACWQEPSSPFPSPNRTRGPQEPPKMVNPDGKEVESITETVKKQLILHDGFLDDHRSLGIHPLDWGEFTL